MFNLCLRQAFLRFLLKYSTRNAYSNLNSSKHICYGIENAAVPFSSFPHMYILWIEPCVLCDIVFIFNFFYFPFYSFTSCVRLILFIFPILVDSRNYYCVRFVQTYSPPIFFLIYLASAYFCIKSSRINLTEPLVLFTRSRKNLISPLFSSLFRLYFVLGGSKTVEKVKLIFWILQFSLWLHFEFLLRSRSFLFI